MINTYKLLYRITLRLISIVVYSNRDFLRYRSRCPVSFHVTMYSYPYRIYTGARSARQRTSQTAGGGRYPYGIPTIRGARGMRGDSDRGRTVRFPPTQVNPEDIICIVPAHLTSLANSTSLTFNKACGISAPGGSPFLERRLYVHLSTGTARTYGVDIPFTPCPLLQRFAGGLSHSLILAARARGRARVRAGHEQGWRMYTCRTDA